MSKRVQCAVSIGSNVEPRKHIQIAIKRLRQQFGNIVLSSSYASQAVLFEGNDFINLVALINTTLDRSSFAKEIKSIEQQIEPHSRRLENRKIDLDLLLYGEQCFPEYNVPHKDVQKFSFTACPLAELLPQGTHPQDGTPYWLLCNKLKNNPVLKRLDGL